MTPEHAAQAAADRDVEHEVLLSPDRPMTWDRLKRILHESYVRAFRQGAQWQQQQDKQKVTDVARLRKREGR